MMIRKQVGFIYFNSKVLLIIRMFAEEYVLPILEVFLNQNRLVSLSPHLSQSLVSHNTLTPNQVIIRKPNVSLILAPFAVQYGC